MINNPYIMMKPGDWKCSYCNDINFASRYCCRNTVCRGKNPNIQLKKGDWYCKCGDLNFASRITCRKCDLHKSEEKKKSIIAESGDWFCLECNELNFKNRKVCFKCGKGKETELKIKEKDNKCIICMDADIDSCFQCGHLACCYVCACTVYKCPICRFSSNPDKVIKTFSVY